MKRKNIETSKNILEENSDSDEEEENQDSNEDGVESGGDDSEEDEINDDSEEEVADNNLDASATDSDDSEEEIGEEPKPTRADVIKKDVLDRYQERQGKQLYIRFPHKLPNTEDDLEKNAKELSPLITKVHKPRQKHARFCLVDFNTKEDRDAALKKLRNSIQKGELAKYIVNIPRTESIEYVNELAERKIKSVENKKAKARLKKASKKALNEKIFTPSVVLLNLPKTASLIQIRELFPNAVDIQIKAGKGRLNKDKSIAAVTLPSTIEARKAVKQKLSLGGNQLMVKFDNQTLKKKIGKSPQQKKQHSKNKKIEGNIEDNEAPTSKKPRIESSNGLGDSVDKPKTKTAKIVNNDGQKKKNKLNKKKQKVI